jgi:hypothetical protein
MVRLKVAGVIQVKKCSFQFQFHYGSIKGVYFETPNTAELDFNSTMVRLKVRNADMFETVGKGFQFHYGSIKGY